MPSAAPSTFRQPVAAGVVVPDAPTIDEALRTSEGAAGWIVTVVESAGSTNSDLLATIRRDGFRSPAVLVARQQTAGRGRLGRTWASTAAASLTASFALLVERPMAALDGVTLACGLAVRDAIALQGVAVRLKWPNDLLVDGRKLGGILVEVLPAPHGTVLVVGVGINVETGDDFFDGGGRGLPATDLRSAGGHAVDRNRLVVAIAAALTARMATFGREGFAAFVQEWNRHDAFGDRPVTLQAGATDRIGGVARGVDSGGALLIDTAEGRRRIVSGDLSLRLAESR